MNKPLPPMVIMGVSGTGKNSVGEYLAVELGIDFVDGDDLHPASNVQKMRSGTPLEDEDRVPWLKEIGVQLAAYQAKQQGVIIACSALKRWYRELLRHYAPDVLFIHLAGGAEILTPRMQAREGHFMPVSLLQSQLATLESLANFERFIEVDISPSIVEVQRDALRQLQSVL